MGAQVIMAVRHDMLHKITPQIIHGLSRMASINDLIPRHFESARIDDASRVTIGDGLDKQGVLCSHYHDMDHMSTLLINKSFMCSMPQLSGIERQSVNSFADVAKFVAGQIRKRRYPFSSARSEHSLEKVNPSPLLPPDSGMISLFSYYTDSWEWSPNSHSSQGSALAKEQALADMVAFCRTGFGHRRTFGFYDPVRGYDGNHLTPLATFPAHLMAFVSMHMGVISVQLLPATKLDLQYGELDIDLTSYQSSNTQLINDFAFKSLMDAQGYWYQRKPKPRIQLDPGGI